MKLQFESDLVSHIIDLDHILKLRLELIKCRNDNATQKFYGLQVFKKVSFLMNKMIFLNILKNKDFSFL